MTEEELYLQGYSIPDINKKTGIPLSTLRNRFKKKGILRSRVDSLKLASKQGKLSKKGRTHKVSEETKKRLSQIKYDFWKDKKKGYRLCSNGYFEYTTGENKGRLVHVVLMESIIGRRLFSNECVHHINGIKTDNREENLVLLTKKEHSSLHAKKNNENRNRDEKGRYK